METISPQQKMRLLILTSYYRLCRRHKIIAPWKTFEGFLETDDTISSEERKELLRFQEASVGDKVSLLQMDVFKEFLEIGSIHVRSKSWGDPSTRKTFFIHWLEMNQAEADGMESFVQLDASLGGDIKRYPQEEINKFKVPVKGEDPTYDLIKSLLPQILISDKHNTNAYVDQTSPKNLAKYTDENGATKYVIFEEC